MQYHYYFLTQISNGKCGGLALMFVLFIIVFIYLHLWFIVLSLKFFIYILQHCWRKLKKEKLFISIHILRCTT